MISIIASTVLILLIINQSACQNAITISCAIEPVTHVYIGRINTCRVNVNPNVISEDTGVIEVIGGSLDNVKIFYASRQTINYIPRGLAWRIPSLTGIRLEYTQLKVVRGCDLAPFGEALTYFSIMGNDVEYLEPNLFANNPNLELACFRGNRISYIDPTVFNPAMNKLNVLFLAGQRVACPVRDYLTRALVLRNVPLLSSSTCTNPANKPQSYRLFEESGFTCW